MILSKNTVTRLLESEKVRLLVPAVAVHPRDLVARAESGCGNCRGAQARRRQQKERQVEVIVSAIARALVECSDIGQVKAALGEDQLVVYVGGRRHVL